VHGRGDLLDTVMIPGTHPPEGLDDVLWEVTATAVFLAREVAGEHSGNELLGGRLATAAGHADEDDAVEPYPPAEDGESEPNAPVQGPEKVLPRDTPGFDEQPPSA
jgi:hypothetical protein